MSSYYDAFGAASGPPDPWEDEAERGRPIPANRLVSTFIRPGLAEYDRRSDEARKAASRFWICRDCGTEKTASEMEHHHCEEPPQDDAIDDLDWSDLNDEDSGINIVTGEVEK